MHPKVGIRRIGAVSLLPALLLAPVVASLSTGGAGARALQGAPQGPVPCGATRGTVTTPAIGDAEPPSTAAEDMPFDQFFIDANVPHHAAIVAFSAAALTRLEDVRLRDLALTIIQDQAVEIENLRQLRKQLYDDSVPAPPDDRLMAMMMSVPGMEGMDPTELAAQMDPATVSARMCTAEDVDLAFIDLTIAHHGVAVMMAEAAMTQAENGELQKMAEIMASTQRAQIEQLRHIRAELTGEATPEAAGA